MRNLFLALLLASPLAFADCATKTVKVSGMTCAACRSTVTTRLKRLVPVDCKKQVKVSLDSKTALVPVSSDAELDKVLTSFNDTNEKFKLNK